MDSEEFEGNYFENTSFHIFLVHSIVTFILMIGVKTFHQFGQSLSSMNYPTLFALWGLSIVFQLSFAAFLYSNVFELNNLADWKSKFPQIVPNWFLGSFDGKASLRTVIAAAAIFPTTFAPYYMLGGIMKNGSLAHAPTIIDSIYFSYVTWFTVGYGDLTPADGISKFITIFEMLFAAFLSAAVLATFIRVFEMRVSEASISHFKLYQTVAEFKKRAKKEPQEEDKSE